MDLSIYWVQLRVQLVVSLDIVQWWHLARARFGQSGPTGQTVASHKSVASVDSVVAQNKEVNQDKSLPWTTN